MVEVDAISTIRGASAEKVKKREILSSS